MAKVSTTHLRAVFLLASLSGCSMVPQSLFGGQSMPEPRLVDQRQQARDAQRISTYFNTINPPPSAAAKVQVKPQAPLKLTIREAVEQFVPKAYNIKIHQDVKQASVITYNPSMPWMEAMGKGLAAIGIEMDANLYKKAMVIRPFEMNLDEVIEKHIPADYKVYTDADVNALLQLRYDETLHWVDALSKSALDVGLDITANITKKLIVIKPMVTTNKDQIQQKP